jgi:hypothetical protein
VVKKVIALFVLIIYGFSTFGAAVNFHYCCGKLDKINFIRLTQKSCCKMAGGHAQENKGCCKDKSISLKLKGEQTAATIFTSTPLSIAIIHPFTRHSFSTYAITCNIVPEVFAPPPIIDFSKLYCTFRI